MRRYWEEQRPPSMTRGSLLLRLLSGIGMLALIGLLIVKTGDPSMWRWFADENGRAAENEPAHTPPPILDATGPTHEDAEQQTAVREEFQAITDGTTNLQKVEMIPYARLVLWTKNQPFERMWRLARGDMLYTQLYDEPNKYRGELIRMKVNVHRTLDAGEIDGTRLHEVIGVTENSWGRPYFLIVVDYPKDMPVGDNLSESAKFVGYFLKLQGYEPVEAEPGDPVQKTPLLIGRIEWTPPVTVKKDSSVEWFFGLAALIIIVVFAGVMFIFTKLKPRRTVRLSNIATSPAGEVISIESWLDQADATGDEDTSNADGDERPAGGDDLDV